MAVDQIMRTSIGSRRSPRSGTVCGGGPYGVEIVPGEDDVLILASVLALDLAEDRERQERHERHERRDRD